MIDIILNEQVCENIEAINTMRILGFSDEEIQRKVNEQNEKDERMMVKKYKVYTDSTLKAKTKAELIEIIREAEKELFESEKSEEIKSMKQFIGEYDKIKQYTRIGPKYEMASLNLLKQIIKHFRGCVNEKNNAEKYI